MADTTFADAGDLEFELVAGDHGIGDLAVLSFEAEEEVSRLFTLDVDAVVNPDVTVDVDALVGQKATLTLHLPDQTDRFFNGVVAEVKSWQEGGAEIRNQLRVRVVPALWKLGHKRRSRIFQDMSVTDIVKDVLDEGGVDQRWALGGDYGDEEYIVQYDESDLDFVSRLLEDAGIFYYFEHTSDAHTMVLGDNSTVWGELPGGTALPFHDASGLTSDNDYVESLLARAEVRPGAVTLRDFNYLTPAVDLTSQAQSDDDQDGAQSDKLEIYEYPGGYDEGEAGDKLAQIRLEEARVPASTAEGSSLSRRLSPGYIFDLSGHPIDALNGKYHLISVQHRGDQSSALTHADSAPERYRNQFTALREELPFRPERLTEDPVIAGPQTAIVVGPANEEIYTDEHGRVKVQFHWDREGQNDDKSSCWMRVSQAWAGMGWGALYLPRVGQEVVVEFLEGDPSQPIVTGAVYNGVNPPPISLPGDKTQSTIRSASSPGGDGSNELRFEDAQGSEEVFLHAQKDLSIVVENDKTQTVGGDESLTVEGDRSRQVGGSQSLQVIKDDSSTIGGNQAVEVGGARSTNVNGSDSESVGGGQAITVGGSFSLSVGGVSTEAVAMAKTLAIGGVYDIVVGAAMSEAIAGIKTEEVGGTKTEVVGGDKTETITGQRTLVVGGDVTEQVGGARTYLVKGDSTLSVGGKLTEEIKDVYIFKAKEITFDADESFSVKVGSALLSLDKDGTVAIKGDKIAVKSSGDVVIKGSKISNN